MSEQSRLFSLSIHSEAQVSLSVLDTLINNIEFKSNSLIIQKFGREVYNVDNVKIMAAYSKNVQVYSFLALYEN